MVHPYRERNMSALADKLGFQFYPEDDYGMEIQLQDFRLFSQGRSKSIDRIMRKQDGLMDLDVAIFDYSYQIWGSSGKDDRVHQTVFFLQSAKLGLPELWLQPETIVHKLGELVGFTDIDFVRFPKFSGNYRLTGGDEEYIRHHFNDEVLNYFTMNKGWSMEGIGFYLLFYRKGTLISSAQIEQFFKRGQEVYKMMTDEEA
ncbi:MAG: hypothetical protein ACJA0J_002298 [Bdellovibrionota bacterium]|jgi:hypothetical protein|nr:hypothetical protein [Lewinella sp.]